MVAEEYEELEFIGRGSYGQIRKARRIVDGKIVARKEIAYHRMSEKEIQQLKAEFDILKNLRHPNIVEYIIHEHLAQEKTIHVYMEYCGNGDLARTISKCKADKINLRERWIWGIFTQLVLALYRCHNGTDAPPVGKSAPVRGPVDRRILHRDLKPENVFLGEFNEVKLGDFGLSKALDPGRNFSSTYVGTPYYMAPEIINEQAHTHKCDIWSLGCIIYELCALAPPFDAKSHVSLNEKIKTGRYAPIPSQYSSALRATIDRCLQIDSTKRPDTGDLLGAEEFRAPRVEIEAVALSREVMAKQEKLRRDEEEAKRLWEQRNLRLRHEIDTELRAKWEALAAKEIQKHKLEIQQQAEAEINCRVISELQKFQAQLQKEFTLRLEGEVQAQLERKIAELDLAPRSSTPGSSLNSSGTSSNDSSISEQCPKSPVGALFHHSFVPDSPADITMASPSHYWSPGVLSNLISNEPPPHMPLREMPPPKSNEMRPPLLHNNTIPASSPTKQRNIPETPCRPQSARPALKENAEIWGVTEAAEAKLVKRTADFASGSPGRLPPVIRPRMGLARAGTTGFLNTAGNVTATYRLDGNWKSADDVAMVRPAGNKTRPLSIVEIARERERKMKELKGEVATWNPATEPEMPSPFLNRYHRV